MTPFNFFLYFPLYPHTFQISIHSFNCDNCHTAMTLTFFLKTFLQKKKLHPIRITLIILQYNFSIHVYKLQSPSQVINTKSLVSRRRQLFLSSCESITTRHTTHSQTTTHSLNQTHSKLLYIFFHYSIYFNIGSLFFQHKISSST